jgi:DmsE family decaheme c-type cytochrome
MFRQTDPLLSAPSFAWQFLSGWPMLLLFMLAAPLLQAARADAPVAAYRTPTFTAQGSASCLRCHSGEKIRAVNGSPHGDADRPGTPAAGLGCEACHGPGSIHISRAHGGRGFPPLRMFGRGAGTAPRQEQLETCLGCHAADVGEAEPIGFYGSPHDRNTINCSTCHTAHAEVDPVRDQESQTAICRRCHRRQIEAHPRFEDTGIEFGNLTCSACHDVHAVAKAVDP